jgi:cell division protein FtsZ
MTLNLTIPSHSHTDFTPRITVIGVGGGGTNAVDNMIAMNLQGVEFVVANTDAQQLLHSRADRRIQLGPHITQGLGAGAKPEIGRAAAEEAADELYRHLEGAHMVFITAGMGGGTGTGAAPVIARMAREKGILTVGVVTKPFTFEGSRRMRSAEQGIEELQQFVDTLIVIPNQNLFRLANERTGWKEAFKMADEVLYMGVRGVTDLMVAPGLVNLDFADIRTVMAEMGKAMMGTGEADGEDRAIRAAEKAINNPLLEDTSMSGARGLLINITGGEDMTLFEVDQAANRIREEVDEEANIIFGSAIDETLVGKIRVSVVATGIDTPAQRAAERPKLVAVGGGAAAAVSETPLPGPMPGAATHAPAAAAPSPLARTPAAAPAFGRPAVPVPPRTQPQPASYRLQPSPVPPAARPAAPAAAPAAPTMTEAQAEPFAEMPEPLSYGEPPRMAQPAPAQAPAPNRNPLRGLGRGAEPRVAGRPNGLFAPEPTTAPATAPAAAAPPPRKSLFGIVTGAIRGVQQHSEAPAAPSRREAPAQHPALADLARADVRQTAGEEMPLDIPAFLRRQSS